jgi:hypothetical protein
VTRSRRAERLFRDGDLRQESHWRGLGTAVPSTRHSRGSPGGEPLPAARGHAVRLRRPNHPFPLTAAGTDTAGTSRCCRRCLKRPYHFPPTSSVPRGGTSQVSCRSLAITCGTRLLPAQPVFECTSRWMQATLCVAPDQLLREEVQAGGIACVTLSTGTRPPVASRVAGGQRHSGCSFHRVVVSRELLE